MFITKISHTTSRDMLDTDTPSPDPIYYEIGKHAPSLETGSTEETSHCYQYPVLTTLFLASKNQLCISDCNHSAEKRLEFHTQRSH